ncbi:hypothetical protein NPIL_531191 [Nephila pilipes]|uniref:Uncharacterized protein n=1 Tax=Nephila pilipes TaxID=299642 RepID=A0A8X6NET4_NEPPI|nr:hypothetical protein NPIL_531191 [Nephila pilipes]
MFLSGSQVSLRIFEGAPHPASMVLSSSVSMPALLQASRRLTEFVCPFLSIIPAFLKISSTALAIFRVVSTCSVPPTRSSTQKDVKSVSQISWNKPLYFSK